MRNLATLRKRSRHRSRVSNRTKQNLSDRSSGRFCFLSQEWYIYFVSFQRYGIARRTEEKYAWTSHARMKMRHYRLTEARVKRIIRHPARTEEGILPGGVACMQVAEGKTYSEIWAMYILAKQKDTAAGAKQIRIITAWRYPGKSPARDPIPPEILREIRTLI